MPRLWLGRRQLRRSADCRRSERLRRRRCWDFTPDLEPKSFQGILPQVADGVGYGLRQGSECCPNQSTVVVPLG